MTTKFLDYPDDKIEREKCREFLMSDLFVNTQLQEIADRSRKVLEIMLDDILSFKNDLQFIDNIKQNAQRYIDYFESSAEALLPARSITAAEDTFDILERQRNMNRNADSIIDGASDFKIRRFEVQLISLSSEPLRNLRDINATNIGNLLKVRGLIVRATDVKPYIRLSTYTCEVCGSEIFQSVTTCQYMPLIKCDSPRCKDNKTNGRPVMINRGSVFVKYQELRLQELPDQVPVGHIPRSLSVYCWGEQTRQCVPGDVVTASGVFLSVRLQGYHAIKSGLLADTYIRAMKIEKVKPGGVDASELEAKAGCSVRDIALDTDTYNRLAASIAPEIFGHEDVKKALLLQLVGAETKVMADGMKIRGDINICLMGDPGVAKSQLLKYIARISPRGVYTTGKGSSGVGLTAAVVRDEVSGEMALEGGALVLADCGICCIDEVRSFNTSYWFQYTFMISLYLIVPITIVRQDGR